MRLSQKLCFTNTSSDETLLLMSRLGLKSNALLVISVSWSSLFALGLVDNARGPVLPDLSSEFSLSLEARSLFFFVSSLSAFVHNVAVFKFLERESAIKLIGLYSLVLAFGSAALAFANSFNAVLLAAVAMGVGFGGLGVGQNSALKNLGPRMRARAVAGLHAMYGLASIIAPVVAVAFFPDWRKVFILFALPSLAVALYSTFADRAFSLQSRGSRGGFPHSSTESPQSDSREGAPTAGGALSSPFKWLWLGMGAIAVGGAVVLEIALSSRIVSIMREDWGVSPEVAGLYLSGFFVALTLGRIGLGLFPVTGGRLRWVLRGCVVLSIAGTLVSVNWGGRMGSSVGGLIFGVGLSVGMLYPLLIELLSAVFGEAAQRAIVVATTAQVGFLMLMHLGIGRAQAEIGQTGGVALALAVGGLFAVIGVEALLRRMRFAI